MRVRVPAPAVPASTVPPVAACLPEASGRLVKWVVSFLPGVSLQAGLIDGIFPEWMWLSLSVIGISLPSASSTDRDSGRELMVAGNS